MFLVGLPMLDSDNIPRHSWRLVQCVENLKTVLVEFCKVLPFIFWKTEANAPPQGTNLLFVTLFKYHVYGMYSWALDRVLLGINVGKSFFQFLQVQGDGYIVIIYKIVRHTFRMSYLIVQHDVCMHIYDMNKNLYDFIPKGIVRVLKHI